MKLQKFYQQCFSATFLEGKKSNRLETEYSSIFRWVFYQTFRLFFLPDNTISFNVISSLSELKYTSKKLCCFEIFLSRVKVHISRNVAAIRDKVYKYENVFLQLPRVNFIGSQAHFSNSGKVRQASKMRIRTFSMRSSFIEILFSPEK